MLISIVASRSVKQASVLLLANFSTVSAHSHSKTAVVDTEIRKDKTQLRSTCFKKNICTEIQNYFNMDIKSFMIFFNLETHNISLELA